MKFATNRALSPETRKCFCLWCHNEKSLAVEDSRIKSDRNKGAITVFVLLRTKAHKKDAAVQ